MQNQFINISGDKALADQSPIPIFIWVIMYVVTALFLELDLVFFLVVFMEFIICQVLFQYHPRVVFLGMTFLTKHSKKAPTFEDEDYVADETLIKNLNKIIKKKQKK